MPKKDKALEVNATEITQQGKKLYVLTMDSRDLFDVTVVSRREENKERGYQRNLRGSRAREIARFVDEDKGIIPNSIIVNFDKSVKFSNGQLTIPRKKDAGWIIDGQHRLYGLHFAKANFPVCVVAFIDIPLSEQINLFITINRTQKGVPSSLFLDLLPHIKGTEESLERKARDLVEQLNLREDSPWQDNINMTGEGQGAISLVNFVRKLKPIIDPDGGALRTASFEEQYKIIRNYFTAVKTVFSDEWVNPKSLIKKTLGFGALMEAFPDIFNYTRQEYGKNVSINSFIQLLKKIPHIKFDAELLGAGTGTKAEKEAGRRLVAELETVLRAGEDKEKGEYFILEDENG